MQYSIHPTFRGRDAHSLPKGIQESKQKQSRHRSSTMSHETSKCGPSILSAPSVCSIRPLHRPLHPVPHGPTSRQRSKKPTSRGPRRSSSNWSGSGFCTSHKQPDWQCLPCTVNYVLLLSSPTTTIVVWIQNCCKFFISSRDSHLDANPSILNEFL